MTAPVPRMSAQPDIFAILASMQSDIRNLITRFTKVPNAILHDTAIGATLTTGALGITSGITIPTYPYPFLVVANYSALINLQATPSDVVDISIRLNGSTVRSSRGSGTNFSQQGNYTFVAAAGTTPNLQLIITKVSGSGSTQVTSNGLFTWLDVITIPQ